MAYFLFIDQSGTDRKEAPYEVLAGVSVEASRAWSLITAIHDAEELHFGQRISGSAVAPCVTGRSGTAMASHCTSGASP